MTDEFANDESRDAAAWIARLDRGDLNSAEEEELSSWLRANPANAAELRQLASLWDSIADGADELPEEQFEPAPPSEFPGAANENDRPWVRPVIAASMAAGLLLLGTVAFLRDDISAPATMASHATVIGEQREIQLADGSIAELNTNSKVAVRYADTERLVLLDYGEAHFKVAKDRQRPFRVLATNRYVEAVGTAFSVQVLGDDQIEVIVSEGTVRIVPVGNDQEVVKTLAAGDRYHGGINDSAVMRLEANKIDESLAWQHGELIFDDEPLAQVVDEIQRYTPRTITITDETVRSRKVGGYFLTSEAEQVLGSLEDVLQLRVEYLEDEIRISDAAQ